VFLRSLIGRPWLISLVVCAAVGVMLGELYRQSSAAQVGGPKQFWHTPAI
jgi:hypothetical protein